MGILPESHHASHKRCCSLCGFKKGQRPMEVASVEADRRRAASLAQHPESEANVVERHVRHRAHDHRHSKNQDQMLNQVGLLAGFAHD